MPQVYRQYDISSARDKISKIDYEVMYRLATEFGFADRIFGILKGECSVPVAEDILRPGLTWKCYIVPMRIIGLAGWSGSGKTTLLTKVIPRIVARGLTVSTLKHAHHDFDIDVPGKDSHSHRVAGATEVLVGSSRRWALVHELRGASELTLATILAKLSPVDLVLIEGYKAAPHPKLEVHRGALGEPLLAPGDPAIIAVASDIALPAATVPVVHLDDVERIVDVLIRHAVPRDTVMNQTGQS